MQCILNSSQHVLPQRRVVKNSSTSRHVTVCSIANTKRDKKNSKPAARVSRHTLQLPCISKHYTLSTDLPAFQVTGITQLSNGKSQHFGSPSILTAEEQPANEPNTSQTNKTNITDLLKGASQRAFCLSVTVNSEACFVTFSVLYFCLLHFRFCVLLQQHISPLFYLQAAIHNLCTSLTQSQQKPSTTNPHYVQHSTVELQA